MEAWKLVVEGSGVASNAKALAETFVDIMRASGEIVKQATVYAGEGRPGIDVTPGSVPPVLMAASDRLDAEDDAVPVAEEPIPAEEEPAP